MNRIVIIGNGFDKAHGLATGYRDFIDRYWTRVFDHIFEPYKRSNAQRFGVMGDPIPYEDEFISFKVFRHIESRTTIDETVFTLDHDVYSKVRRFIVDINQNQFNSVGLTFKNRFFQHISERCSLTNWVDVENEDYGKLKALLAEDNDVLRNEKVRDLNRDFEAVKKKLEIYLTEEIDRASIEPFHSIQEAFDSMIEPEEVACGKQKIFVESILTKMGTVGKDQEKGSIIQADKPKDTLILNFNYTHTAEKWYARAQDSIINIHGELNSHQNPIIFGYGDELDDDYKRIEKLQDNDFLENIKSVRYHETGNYRRLLEFIESEPYQVITMGHSCGNSDRTLLHTVFEHPNCISVKVYYHLREDGTDDYSQLIRNLSRNFNDKAAMRDQVVNKEKCLPLVPEATMDDSRV